MPPEPQAPSLREEIKEYWAELGPGLTSGAADDDPSGIATYSQVGARYGLQLLWLALFTYPFLAVVQEMCARIGLVSGRGLAANIRRHHSATALYLVAGLLFVTNIVTIAANLGAMAAAAQLLVPAAPGPLLVVGFALVSLVLQLALPYRVYAQYLKYLTFALLSYVAVALVIDLEWTRVLYHTFTPSLTWSDDQILLLCAVLGTTISPYLFFWQTAQEVEEKISHGQTSIKARQHELNPAILRAMRHDVWGGMGFSQLVAYFIIAACAGTLYANGITDITSAAAAAEALRPFGEFAYVLFAVGIIGTGLIAVPVLAGSTAYTIAESMGWRYGFFRKLRQAGAFYGIIVLSTGIGMVGNFFALDPIHMLIYAAAINGIIAPAVLYFVVRLSSNPQVMGAHVNTPLAALAGWLTIGAMALVGVAALGTLVY